MGGGVGLVFGGDAIAEYLHSKFDGLICAAIRANGLSDALGMKREA